jgi:hypothetical protein
MLVLAGNRPIVRGASRPATEEHAGTSPEVVAEMWRSHAARSTVPHGR